MRRIQRVLAGVVAFALLATGTGLCALADLMLPAALTAIAAEAFRGDKSVTEVTIPDNCSEIGPYAFADCTNLWQVVIPDSVSRIGEHAFDNCPELLIRCGQGSAAAAYAAETGLQYDTGDTAQSGTWGDGITWRLTPSGTIVIEGSGVLRGYDPNDPQGDEASPWYSLGDQVSAVQVGEGITALGDNAFRGCCFTSIHLPDTLERIGASAFYQANVRQIVIPDSVIDMGAHAFACSALNSIRLSAGMTRIPDSCFAGSFGSGSALSYCYIPEGITTIGDGAFQQCYHLAEITLPESLESIGAGAFGYCESLQAVALPDALTAIGSKAFYECKKLAAVTLPDSRLTIGKYAFARTAVETIEISGGIRNMKAAFAFDMYTSYNNRVSSNKLHSVTLLPGATAVSEAAFMGSHELTQVNLPDTVRTIGSRAFKRCVALESIVVPDSVSMIRAEAFAGCENLAQITLPASVLSIDPSAFAGCEGLTILCEPGSAAETFAISQDIDRVATDMTYQDEETAWYVAPVLTSVSGDGGVVELAWQGNADTDTYGVYELIEGIEVLRGVFTGTQATLYGVTDGPHSFAVRPMKPSGDASVTGIISNAMAVSMTGGAQTPRLTYADETGPLQVTLRWIGSAERFDVLEQGADGGLSVLKSVAANEAILDGVSAGMHAYYIRAHAEGGATALSSAREVLVLGPRTVALDADGLTLYPQQSARLTATLSPADAGDAELTWTSSDTAVATVTADGTVTGVATGSAVITCACANGGSAACEVTVPERTTITSGDFTVEDGVLTGYKGSAANVVIPADLGIWKIGRFLFGERTLQTSVTIPEGVTSIGEYAFYMCSSLTSVTIPDSVTSIGDYAFEECNSLTSVTIPDSVTRIGKFAFSGNSGLTGIGKHAFSGCSSLTSVTIPEGVTSIGEVAFVDCSSLTSVTIPEGVTSIGKSAFLSCSSLTSVVIPNSVTVIGERAFWNCSSLTSVAIPKGVTSIGEKTFEGCSNLTSVTIPDSVTSIDIEAFYSCDNLTNVTIPASVTSIGKKAFYGCSSLTSVTILEGVTSIGQQAFEGCSSLTSVTIPDSVTKIDKYAFRDCSGLTSVTIPDSVTSIDEYAFYKCSNLTSVVIPNSVTVIGSAAFGGCRSLTSVTIPEGVKSIRYYTFGMCSSLTSVTIPEGVTSIDESAFTGCRSLTSVTIPDSVTKIDKYAFSGCRSLTSMMIPDSVTSIGNWAFGESPSLTTVYGVHGSYAEQFANSYSIDFRPIEEYDPSGETGGSDVGDEVVTDASGAALMCTGMKLSFEAIFGEPVLLTSLEGSSSSDESVVSTQRGYAEALSMGTATLTASLISTGAQATRAVKVLGGFKKTKLELLEGEQAALQWDAVSGHSPGAPYHYHDALTAEEAVVIGADGVVTALAPKTIRPDHIRMDMGDGLYTQCDVYVRWQPSVVKIEPNSVIISVGESKALPVSVGGGELSRGFTCNPADRSIVSAVSNVVTGLAVGTTTVKVSAHNGVSGQCSVTVVPEGFDEEEMDAYLRDLESACRDLIRMSSVFDGGYDRPNGTHVDGIDPDSMTNGVQAAYAALLGSNADTVFSREVRTLYLADAIMCSISTGPEKKWVTVKDVTDTLNKIDDFGDFTQYVSKLLTVLANESGYISLDLSSAKGDLLKYYKENNLYDSLSVKIPDFSVAEDLGKVAESFLTAWRKYELYMTADQAKLDRYIQALRLSDDPDTLALAHMLDLFRVENRNDCLVTLLYLHGFIKGYKTAAKYIWKYFKKKISVLSPIAGLYLAGIKVSKISNSFLFNLNDVQKNVFRTQYVIKAVNGYRSVFEDALDAFIADPLNPDSFRRLSFTYDTFSRLVCEEYKSFGKIASAEADSAVGWVGNLLYDGILDENVASFDKAGENALIAARVQLLMYENDVLGLSD